MIQERTESDFDSIVAVSQPPEEEFETNIESASIEGEEEENQATVNEDVLSFNLNIALALVEENGVAIESEFTEAVGELEGRKEYVCQRCEKICKSKCGLTRHVNANHPDQESTGDKQN